MKRLLFGTLLILSICASTYKIIGGHGFAICLVGIVSFCWFCLYCYNEYVNRKVKEEIAAMKKMDISHIEIKERHYHEGIEVIARICVN
jgi:hypothetical protein